MLVAVPKQMVFCLRLWRSAKACFKKEGISSLLLLSGFIAAPYQARATGASCAPEKIVGHWRFVEFIYEGKTQPPMNPNLNLEFEFFPNGRNRLFWTRTTSRFFCEREGQYLYNQCQLMDLVTHVNPKNGPDCGSDPDMKVGRWSVNRVDFRGEAMQLHLSLSGKPFIYVWRRVEKDNEDSLF